MIGGPDPASAYSRMPKSGIDHGASLRDSTERGVPVAREGPISIAVRPLHDAAISSKQRWSTLLRTYHFSSCLFEPACTEWLISARSSQRSVPSSGSSLRPACHMGYFSYGAGNSLAYPAAVKFLLEKPCCTLPCLSRKILNFRNSARHRLASICTRAVAGFEDSRTATSRPKPAHVVVHLVFLFDIFAWQAAAGDGHVGSDKQVRAVQGVA